VTGSARSEPADFSLRGWTADQIDANLLPLLPLDGGNILFAIIEGIRGRTVPRRSYERFSTFGLALIVLITVIAFSHTTRAWPRGKELQ
jgi:Peptidase family M50